MAKGNVDPSRVPATLAQRFQAKLKEGSVTKVGSTLWPYLGTRGAQFRLGDRKIGTEMELVILDAVHIKQFFEGDYDPDNARGPVCFAISAEKGVDAPQRMAPPADLPSKVSTECRTCPWNQWKSGKGRGKACKEGFRLIVLGFGAGGAEHYAKTDGARLNVPPTSIKRLADYTKALEERGRPIDSVVTKVVLEPGDKGGFNMFFEHSKDINDLKILDALELRRKQGQESLLAPPNTEVPGAAKLAKQAGGGARKVRAFKRK